jgi:hypothetical protein
MIIHHFCRRSKSWLTFNTFLGLCIIAVFTLEFGEPARSFLSSSPTFTINENFANLNLPWTSGNNPNVKRPEEKGAGKNEAALHHPLADSWLYGFTLHHLQLLSNHFSNINTVFYRHSPQVSLLLDLPPPTSP